jgi:hypothetical protein
VQEEGKQEMRIPTVVSPKHIEGVLHVMHKVDAERQRFNIMRREHDGLDRYGPINKQLQAMSAVWDEVYDYLIDQYEGMTSDGYQEADDE